MNSPRTVRLLARRLVRSTRAGALIEFAILAPIMLLLMVGSIAYAIYLGAAHAVQQLAADAARTSVAGLDEVERNGLVTAYFAQARIGGLIDPARLDFDIGDDPDDPDSYRIVVRYDASALPIWNLYPPLPLPSTTITFASIIRKGGR